MSETGLTLHDTTDIFCFSVPMHPTLLFYHILHSLYSLFASDL